MMVLGPPFLGAIAADGGVQAWLVLSSPTADEAGRSQREPSYLAALLYVSLCPQQAWLNIRSPRAFPPAESFPFPSAQCILVSRSLEVHAVLCFPKT